MTTRGEINSNFYQIVNVDANGAPTSLTDAILANSTISNVANANFASYSNIANTANSVAVANVGGIGNIATINLSGSTTDVLYGNGVFAPAAGGNSANANYANFAGTAFSVSGSNVSGTVANATYAVSADSATVAGTVTTNAQPNITSVGTLTSLTMTGIINGNIAAASNIWASRATNISINSAAGNANVFRIPFVTSNSATINSPVYINPGNLTYQPTTGNLTATRFVGDVTGDVTGNVSGSAGSANSVAVANVSGIGNIATVNLDGNVSNVLSGTGTWISTGTAVTSNYANFAGTAFSVDGSNVSGIVANANYAAYSNTSNTSITVTSNNQPNITSVGTLDSLVVTGNVQSYANISGGYIFGDGSYLTGIGNLSAARGYWGSFYSNVSQTIASTTTAYPVTLNNTDPDSYGVYISSNSHINFQFAGTFNIQFSAQLVNTDTAVQEADFWIRKNGTDVIDSRGTIAVADKQGAVNGQTISSWNYILKLAANDYIELMWHAESTSVGLENLPAGTTPTTPAAPSMIVTAQQVTNVQPVELQGAMSGNITGNGFSLINIASISSLDGITGNTFTGNGYPLTSINGANVSGYVPDATHANIADVANVAYSVSGANVSGDVSGANHANISDAANVAYSVSAANVVGTVANATYSNIAGVAYSVNGSNVSGDVAGSNHANVADLANSVAVSNVVGIGNIATINLDGNVSNLLTGSGTFVAIPTVSANANYANFAGQVVDATQSNITTLGTLIDLNVEGNIFTNTAVYVGNTSNATGLTNPTIVAKASGATFVQMAIVNGSANGSADLVAYGDNGSDSGAFVDVGFTSSSFDDPLYTITKPNDGYMFVQGDDSSAHGGNLVLATGAQGSTKDIIFATGGFLDTDEKMRYSHSLGQLYVQPNTAATDTTTGALRVEGGVGIAGDVYAGNVVSASYFLGDGGLLSNITVSGNVANANYANFAGTAYSVDAANISGTVNLANYATVANSVAGANVSGVVSQSNLATNITVVAGSAGSTSDKFFTFITANNITGNYTLESQPGMHYWPISGLLYVQNTIQVPTWSSDSTSFLTASKELRVSNRVTSGQFISNIASGTAPFTVTSTTQVANLNVASAGVASNVIIGSDNTTNANFFLAMTLNPGSQEITIDNGSNGPKFNPSTNILTVANITSTLTGNVIGNVSGSANTAATVTTNAQPNITSVGTLTGLSVAGNISAHNISAITGNISALDISAVLNVSAASANVTGTTTTGGLTATGGSVLIENGGANSGTLSVDGAGNAVVFGTIVGNVTIGSGTSTAIMGNLVTANYFSGNGSLLTGITATASPGGSNTELQFNNSGSLGGISTVTYDGINLSLGSIGNVKITGGTTGQVISTDGAGNLSFVAQSGGGGGTDFTPNFLLGGM